MHALPVRDVRDPVPRAPGTDHWDNEIRSSQAGQLGAVWAWHAKARELEPQLDVLTTALRRQLQIADLIWAPITGYLVV
jgi:hypothetical protein